MIYPTRFAVPVKYFGNILGGFARTSAGVINLDGIPNSFYWLLLLLYIFLLYIDLMRPKLFQIR